ncbi:Uncharacterised protein [BD1-7 clade bacterium]|uniref:Sulfur carrier protein ThiS n=1 Tax=BD1-7 clade bacterium TaxID=2029982 RepID=A0A5S9Q823_9GAMM|nr:Uncharacterised protein [BD1-7 clade bacterium]
MIDVSINDQKRTFDGPLSIEAVLEETGYEARKVAVAINTNFVPRSGYAEAIIKAGDKIDILAAVQGG